MAIQNKIVHISIPFQNLYRYLKKKKDEKIFVILKQIIRETQKDI